MSAMLIAGLAPADALAAAPAPSETVTAYSQVVNGNITQAVAGVTVSIALLRPTGSSVAYVAAATGSATTDANGGWTVVLLPTTAASGTIGFAPFHDQLTTTYAVGSAPAATQLPPTSHVGTSSAGNGSNLTFPGGTISPTGSTITGRFANCPSLSYVIDGAVHPTTATPSSDCAFSPATALTDANHVQAVYTTPASASGLGVDVTTISDVGLLGQFQPPTCSGDLVTQIVTCVNLDGGTFAVARNGGTPLALATQKPFTGSPNFTGTVVLPGLTAGDAITLTEAGVARTLTTLHVFPLREDTAVDGTTSGACQPNRLFTFFDDGSGLLCPASGTIPAGFRGTSLLDDLSGGATTITVPFLFNLIPAQDDLVLGPNLTASGDLSLALGSATKATTAQILAATRAVNLQIVPRGSDLR